jgi:hypothetical protein
MKCERLCATFVVYDRAEYMLEQKSAEMHPLITEWLARISESEHTP